MDGNPRGYQTAFCDRYRDFQKRRGLVMRRLRVAGDKMFVDSSEMKAHSVDPQIGEVIKVELFVAELGASSYPYAEAAYAPGCSAATRFRFGKLKVFRRPSKPVAFAWSCSPCRRNLRCASKDMEQSVELIVARARVLACPLRVAIWADVGREGKRPMEIARERGVAPSTVTYHIDVLRRAKLVELSGRGISRVYRWTAMRLVFATEAELAGDSASQSNNGNTEP